MCIVVEGLRVPNWLNGQPMDDVIRLRHSSEVSLDFTSTKSNGQTPFVMEFRNVRIREL